MQTRIDKITSNWAGKNVIGLHIRRTDNVTAISLSPDECFHNIIDQELIKDGNSLFYVASDDQTVKDELCKKYGGHIISIPLCLKRNSKKGMKDAVVDLYCLGSTNYIYGSAHSTYSTFAATLYDKKIKIVGE